MPLLLVIYQRYAGTRKYIMNALVLIMKISGA